MPDWLVFSIIVSVIVTVAVNALLWIFPGIGRSAEQRFLDRMEDQVSTGKRVRVIFPWKWMIIASLAATVLLNIVL